MHSIVPILLLLLIPCATALHIKGSVTSVRTDTSLVFNRYPKAYFPLTVSRFGYLAGGSGDVKFTVTPAVTMRYLLCNTKEYVSGKVCTNYKLCTRNVLFTNSTFIASETIPTSDGYYYVIGNCGGSTVKVAFDLLLLNPNGQHLSSGLIPLPEIYFVFMFIWIGLVALWLGNWLAFWKQRILLHRIVTIVPVLKGGSLALLHYWYDYQSKQGVSNLTLESLSFATRLMYEAALFFALLLVAKGWCIVRPKLRRQEVHIMIWSILFLVIALLCNGLMGGLFLFVVFIMYIIVLRVVFVSVNENIRTLRIQLRLIHDAHIDPMTTPMYSKHLMFKYVVSLRSLTLSRVFLYAMVAYFVFMLLIYAISALFLQSVQWIGDMLLESLEVVVFIGIGFAFRLRDFSPYWESPEEMDTANNTVVPSSGPLAPNELNGDELRAWHPGMAVPAVPAGAQRGPHEPTVVVIQTPTPGSMLTAAVPIQPTYAFGAPEQPTLVGRPVDEKDYSPTSKA